MFRSRRRSLLIGCVLVVSVVTGCTAGPTGDDVAVESVAFDHGDTGSPAIEGGITYPTDGPYTTQFYVTVVDTSSAAARLNHSVLNAEASAFVRATDFDQAVLVVVQTSPASSVPDYRVEAARRTAGGLEVRINDSATAGTGDITVETLLIRVPGEAPTQVTVTTEDGSTFNTTMGVVTVTAESQDG